MHKSKKYKDQKLRINFKKNEKNILLNKFLDSSSFKQKATRSKIKNRCVITNYSRSVLRFASISRHSFRKLASTSKLPGVTKSSW